MPKRNDFMEGFLRGLYQSGLGNPEVQRANEQDVQNRNAALTAKMAEQGQVPGTFPQDHPVSQKIGSFISSMFGGASTQPLLASAFRPDPTQPIYAQENTGQVKQFPPGSVLGPTQHRLSPKVGEAGLMSQYKQDESKPNNATLVYANGKPRIEPAGYLAKPGEQIQPTDLGNALSKIGSFQGNEGRSNFYNMRGTQIGAQMTDQFSKDIDPSELPPTSVLGRAAQSVKRTINALTLMKPGTTVTRADFEAAKGDLDTIVSQASATVEGRKMLNTENIYGKAKEIQSYLSANPQAVSVPENIVGIYRNIVNDIGPIAQETVQSHIDRKYQLMKKSYGNILTPEEMDSFKQQVKDAYDIKKIMSQGRGATPGGTDLGGGFSYTIK